jgi:uncharacterized membrane protein YraQ (UPF0718 family)
MLDWIFSKGFLYGLIAIVVATILGVMIKHYDDNIRASALAEFNLKQAQQVISDQNKMIKDLQEINKDKENIVQELTKQRNAVEQSLVEIEKRIRNDPKLSDRQASDLLKETIRELEGVIP